MKPTIKGRALRRKMKVAHPQSPIHAKIVSRKKVRGGSDIFLGPEKHYVRPESLAEVLRDA